MYLHTCVSVWVWACVRVHKRHFDDMRQRHTHQKHSVLCSTNILKYIFVKHNSLYSLGKFEVLVTAQLCQSLCPSSSTTLHKQPRKWRTGPPRSVSNNVCNVFTSLADAGTIDVGGVRVGVAIGLQRLAVSGGCWVRGDLACSHLSNDNPLAQLPRFAAHMSGITNLYHWTACRWFFS